MMPQLGHKERGCRATLYALGGFSLPCNFIFVRVIMHVLASSLESAAWLDKKYSSAVFVWQGVVKVFRALQGAESEPKLQCRYVLF